MKFENTRSLQHLSLYGQIGGLITIYLGIIVIFMDLINSDFRHAQVGIFICVTGYAFFKIAARSAAILLSERKSEEDKSESKEKT